MVALNRIYTKTGDDGTTALANGERRNKDDLRIEAYGTVDEANACIGLVRQHLSGHPAIDALLSDVQNDLFDLGADLATPMDARTGPKGRLEITEPQVQALEGAIDEHNARLEPLRSFVLPGGSAASAYLHLARTVVRRAERLGVALAREEKVNAAALRYLNRLSDLLFVLGRVANDGGKGDVLWAPGKNRGA
jgi:cob(I)alamin adenosyltransferase